MRVLGPWLLAGLALGAAGKAASADPPAHARVTDAPYPPAFREAVDAAIQRGVQALRQAQDPGGAWEGMYGMLYPHGETALALLTLLKCGVPRTDPAVVRGFRTLRSMPPSTKTYDVGLVLMAVGAQYDHEADASAASEVSKEDLAWMTREVGFLESHRTQGGLWGYPGTPADLTNLGGKYESLWEDLSNVQYAVFGLRAAARCGVPVKTETWSRARAALLAWQAPKGPDVSFRGNDVRDGGRLEWTETAKSRGFSYGRGDRNAEASGSMTAAGTACLLICAEALGDLPPADVETTRRAVRDGLAWLQARFSVAKNPGGDGWYLYYLYGLERVGDLAHARFFGTQDWYQAGAQRLLEKQSKSGGWLVELRTLATKEIDPVSIDPTDTCFALLFLRRSTPPARAVITPDSGPAPAGK